MLQMHVVLQQEDLLEESTSILFDGIGFLEGSCLTCYEDDTQTTKQELHFLENHVILKRHAASSSETDLRLQEKSFARIVSMYGTMMLETFLKEYDKRDDQIMIEYQILQEGLVVTHQRLKWNFMPLQKDYS